ncbi:hypothetical protein CLV56_1617 [Mumia flava]|uniref:Uncharacterized protein n=2 Tax=Mumia flava TaxID=1348852 RepID=A0A0B2BJL9_9ACTN|nr:hypothetical protein CLV56_1617 [Mumia flava]
MVLVALTATAYAVPAAWFERTVVDEEGFVALVSPLFDDPAVRDVVVDDVSDAVMERSGLDGAAAVVAERVVRTATEQVLVSPELSAAWVEVARRSHRIDVTDLPPESLEGRFALDLTPLVEVVVDQANTTLGVDLPVGRDYVVLVGTPEHRQAFDRLRDVTRWWGAGVAVAVAAAIGAVALGRNRGAVTALLGVGLVLVAAGTAVVVRVAVPAALSGDQTESRVLGAVTERIGEQAVESYDVWATATAVGGVVLIVVGLVWLSRSRASRRAVPAP